MHSREGIPAAKSHERELKSTHIKTCDQEENPAKMPLKYCQQMKYSKCCPDEMFY